MQTTKRDIIIFIAISFSLAIILSLSMSEYDPTRYRNEFFRATMASMLIPAISVVIMSFVFRAKVGRLSFRPSVKWIAIALFVMPLAIHALALPLLWFLRDGDIPWEAPSIVRIVFTAILGVAILSPLAFFEEIGWRAWLMPRLAQFMNPQVAIIVGAMIWALWHVPFVFGRMSAIEGLTTNQTLLVPLGTFGAGLVINWIWVKTKNILVVSIAHGALNNWGQLAFKYINDDEHALQLLIGVDVALILTGVTLMTLTKKRKTPFPLDNMPDES